MAYDMEYRNNVKPLTKIQYATLLTANDSSPVDEPGIEMDCLTPFGRAKFRYGKNAAGITRGQLASYVAGISVANITSGSTTTAVTTGLTANAYQYDVAVVTDVNASAGASPEGYCAPILSNTTTTIYFDTMNPLPAALAANDDLYIYTFCKTEASAAGDGVSDCFGVAMTTITATYWGWFQYDGLCPYALVKASTALTAEKGLIADTARISISSTSSDELLIGCLVQGVGFSDDLVDDVVSGVVLYDLGHGRQVSA